MPLEAAGAVVPGVEKAWECWGHRAQRTGLGGAERPVQGDSGHWEGLRLGVTCMWRDGSAVPDALDFDYVPGGP